MEREREDRLLSDIATLLVHLFPGGWEKAEVTYRAVGRSYERISVGGGLVNPKHLKRHSTRTATAFIPAEELLPASGVFDLLRRLRSEMYEARRGTWVQVGVGVYCAIGGRPQWGVTYKRADEVAWGAEVPAAACVEELRAFPREDVPEWMSRAAGAQAAADAVDPGVVQEERELVAALPAGLEHLFVRARDLVRDVAPRASGRFLAGRVADGRWSVVRAPGEGGWAVVGGGGAVPFEHVREAVAYAVGGVLAGAGAEVNSAVLELAGLLHRRTEPDSGRDAWMLTAEGGRVGARTRGLPRPESGAFVALGPIHNRPVGCGYFACETGPPPERGGFVSTHEVFERLAGQMLPHPAPEPEAPEAAPVEVLPPGTELDAYGGTDRPFLFEIGTPFSVRGLYGTADAHPYRVYRVERPLRVHPGLFAGTAIFPTGEELRNPPEEPGRGYYLVDSIADLVASGLLTEITRPGGTPVRRTGQ
ncbi:glycohydrolase toxin TNT-related protein [Actinomadura rugatobispora]|uniref:Glycohydrolase toxin TNT-related protein n=1 Tax=Actinomadura rugatobispora TaxID=1994 RepID=A0ABW0ZW26_9ACTN